MTGNKEKTVFSEYLFLFRYTVTFEPNLIIEK